MLLNYPSSSLKFLVVLILLLSIFVSSSSSSTTSSSTTSTRLHAVQVSHPRRATGSSSSCAYPLCFVSFNSNKNSNRNDIRDTIQSNKILFQKPSSSLFLHKYQITTNLPRSSSLSPSSVVENNNFVRLRSLIRCNMSSSSSASKAEETGTFDDPVKKLNLPSPILLGSASFTRKLILKEMNVSYIKYVRPIDEKALGDRSKNAPPKELVLTIANAKMDHLIQEYNKEKDNNKNDEMEDGTTENVPMKQMEECIFLTGDQVVTCNGNILEKPMDVTEAKKMVSDYATYPPSTVGSCVLHHIPSNVRVSGVDTATIHFKSTISESDLIDRMIKEDNAPILSCAGGLMIEHPLVQERLDHIDGTQDSVMGLSKDLVLRLLKELKDKLDSA